MSRENRKMSSSFWVGAIVLLIGSFLLVDRMDLFEFPWWVFSWPSFLMVVGLIIGINKNFQGIGWLIMILIGGLFFIDNIPGFPYDLDDYGFPVAIIILGLFILVRSLRTPATAPKKIWGDGIVANDAGGDDYFDLTAFFGGVKRKVFSKNFKGGEATSVFGGTEIDLSHADIDGTVVIDVVQLFGGLKLIIPSNWELKSDVTAILGGIDDKRNMPQAGITPGKKIILTGVVIFGGVDIKSF